MVTLGYCLGVERHGLVGRVENIERVAGMGGTRVSQGHPGRDDL